MPPELLEQTVEQHPTLPESASPTEPASTLQEETVETVLDMGSVSEWFAYTKLSLDDPDPKLTAFLEQGCGRK